MNDKSAAKSVRVFCRFRPFNEVETKKNSVSLVNIKTNQIVKIKTEHKQTHSFEFDHIFNDTATQEEVYGIVGKPLINDIMKGYNATIFAYGQTGSGKTMTMSGYSHLVADKKALTTDVLWRNPDEMGVVPRLIQDLFESIKTKQEHEYTIQVSYLEIYLEKVRDLLRPENDNLPIREERRKGIWVDNITETYVGSFDDAVKVMRKGELNRTVAATCMNTHSSRSHSILVINLKQTNIKTKNKITSRMIFVDLAGSEKVLKTKAEGLTLKQAQHTNTSLMTLGLVIRALVENKPHIPYRDSKLTRLLTDSLGGNSKTHLIVTCSSASYNIEETISTLRFGDVTQYIKNKPKVNLEVDIDEYKRLLEEAQNKIQSQKKIIKTLQKDLKKLIKLCEKGNVVDIEIFKKNYSLEIPPSPSPNKSEQLEQFNELTLELDTKLDMITELEESISKLRLENESYRDQLTILADSMEHQRDQFKERELTLLELDTECKRLTELTESFQSDKSEQVRKHKEELKAQQLAFQTEVTGLRDKITQLVSENQGLRETTLRNWKEQSANKGVDILEVTDLNAKYTKLLETEDDLRQQLDSKNRHIKVLEDSLQTQTFQFQQKASDHKATLVKYGVKIKDLESQIRILRKSTPPNNILTPLQY